MNRVMKLSLQLLVCLFLLAVATRVYGEERLTVTLDKAVEMGMNANPNLKAAQAQVEEAYFNYQAAGSLPSLSLIGNYVNGNNTIVTNNGQTHDVNLTAAQTFGPFGSIGAAGKAGFQSYQISKANLDETRLSLTQTIKDDFYLLLSSQEQSRVAEDNLKLANELYDLTQKKFHAGAVPETDLLNAQIQKAGAEQSAVSARAVSKQAQSALNALLGRTASDPIEALGPLDLPDLTLNLEALMKMGRENRPLVKSSELSMEVARTQVQLAKTQRNPSPSLFYTYDLTTTPLYMYGVSLTLPAFDYGTIGNQIKLQEKTVEEKQNSLKNTLLQISSAIKQGYENYTAAFQNASTFKEKVLSPSEKLMKATEYGYREGALSYVQLLIAQQNLKSARTQYVSLLLSGHQALDALDAAVGKQP